MLLNDPTYLEAARAFAERVLRKGGKTTAEHIQYAYREALSRAAKPEEVKVLTEPDLDAAELAAWTSVARVLLNLHETITRN